MRATRGLLVPLSLTLLTLLAAAGCGRPAAAGDAPAAPPGTGQAPQHATGPRVVQEDWPAEVPESGLAAGLALPIEAYLPTYAETIDAQLARDTAETACMNRFGFAGWRTEPLGTAPPPANTSANMPRRYGLTDIEEAGRYGYHLPESPTAEPSAATRTADEEAVLTGRTGAGALSAFGGDPVPAGGCLAEAADAAGGLNADLAEEISGQSFTESQETAAVTGAMAAWSDCMAGQGYALNTVWDTDAHYDTLAPAADAAERDLAVADVSCKQETGLVAIWFETESGIQERLIEENRQALTEAAERNGRVLADAAELTGQAAG
ncbi:hypothetical protein [Streptomyces johnsoniae]|uniref:Lipoprotein n=1 Tax=Streptomyces johnsoniae TaxID=3075532 RepID=A0ABU2S2N1_9ACTN|nr:hypothetical protein [Streptomyces sp. DSM 41886]MDT0443043.1 hypothetical protein [Streptomyces sp. DSM 41886]